MTSPFRWPTQLVSGIKRAPKKSLNGRYILVRKQADPKTGKQKTASSSDGIIDIAAAVHLGLVPSVGLPGLLLKVKNKRVIKLLTHNTVIMVKPKQATVNETHITKSTWGLAKEALPDAIGPAYWEANKHLGVKAALKTRQVISWIKSNLENEESKLCDGLRRTKYQNLVGVKRSRRWWLNLFGLHQNVQSNLTL
jgi:hypothetical protein